jgi:ribonuclease BN (tRNA processing enzyme)
MKVTFVGCGDAFASGGRLNTCFHVETHATSFLIDCGASSLIGLKRAGIDRNGIDTILITHFHADHFGGVPFLILEAQLITKRSRRLTLAGPVGLRDALTRAMESAFAGSSTIERRFEVEAIEIEPDRERALHGFTVRAKRVRHGRPDGPFYGYRISVGDKIIAYTGDTEWVEELVELGHRADLLIAEASVFDRKIPFHLDYATLARNLPRIDPKRVMLTHLSEDMLSRQVAHEAASDGLTITI